MNVATLENCQELHKLSGWEPRHLWMVDQDTNIGAFRYDVGYLLRMLPEPTDDEAWVVWKHDDHWQLWEVENGFYIDGEYALFDSPENAWAYHAIQLFKSGVLQHV